ncbi:hypothetical protein A6A19_01215 [Actinobacillus delphinicola]|uniref:primosomal replication protein PriC n=1 Tax=Actinobacillus delphinicola TaxID=51161 RepID=UPI0024427F5E|nr:primosomal replication protein PriC [Actinobacillus delphinicola]MDG6896649.1 hypothetical protein [Actinobacillus delphinicola]
MSTQNQIQILRQHIQQWQNQFSHECEQTIHMPFEIGLFSQNFETLGYYFAEIMRNIDYLAKVSTDDIQKANFISEKIINQCAALREATQRQFRTTPIKKAPQRISAEREALLKRINALPPRERLEKYYEGLNALNALIEKIKDQLATCPHNSKCNYKKILNINNKDAKKPYLRLIIWKNF